MVEVEGCMRDVGHFSQIVSVASRHNTRRRYNDNVARDLTESGERNVWTEGRGQGSHGEETGSARKRT